jgi:DNA-binding HxlR family transcriptional regulator
MAVSSTENAPGEPIAMDVLRPDCPSRVVMQRIGERWSMFVILALADGPLRFTAVKPPRVEYDLTPLGASLLVPLAGMRAWAEAHVPEVLASRERHLVTP